MSMAKFKATLPDDVIKDTNFLIDNGLEIFKGMTKAGAQVAEKHISSGTNKAFRPDVAAAMRKKLKVTKSYITKSDGGINTKVAFYGYIPKKKLSKDGAAFKIRGWETKLGVPAPFLAALREYGGSLGAMPDQFQRYWRKKVPFVRPAFEKKSEIDRAMHKAQKKLSGGILND